MIEQRRDLGLHRHVARDEDDRAVLAERAREGEREAGEQGGQQRREDDARKTSAAARAEAGRGLLDLGVEVLEHRLQRAHDERQADEGERDDHAERREGDLDAERLERACRASRSARRASVSAMPATAVGSANGRSTSASTRRLPGKR